MSTIALQPRQTISRHYPITDRKLQNSEKVLSNREKRLQRIAFWKQYLEDLKAGRPIENVSPSNDPYYLIPENIAAIIEAEIEFLEGKSIRVNPDNIWECI